jgi:hypothetical protein
MDFAMHMSDCMHPFADMAQGYCDGYVSNPDYTAECAMANEDFFACLTGLDCKMLGGAMEPPFGELCMTEFDAIGMACGG